MFNVFVRRLLRLLFRLLFKVLKLVLRVFRVVGGLSSTKLILKILSRLKTVGRSRGALVVVFGVNVVVETRSKVVSIWTT